MDIFKWAKGMNLLDAMAMYRIDTVKNGRNVYACCPFHREKTASMIIHTSYFKCFGCGAGGDIIKFVEMYFNLTPAEAAKKILMDFGHSPDDLKVSNITAIRKENRKLEIEAEELNVNIEGFFNKCCSLFRMFKDLIHEANMANVSKGTAEYAFIRFHYDFFDHLTERFINADIGEKIELMSEAKHIYNMQWKGVRQCLNSLTQSNI